MPPLFWTGKLSPSMKFMANINSLLALLTGNAINTAAMKRRMKLGYEGTCSDHVTHYDEFGLEHYTRIAAALLEGVDVRDKEILDAGCGTGIVSNLVLKQSSAKVICGDASEYMLGRCREKMRAQGDVAGKVDFRQLDVESVPYGDRSFDVVVSGMLLGLVPNQQRAVTEMARVLRTGGLLAISTHGPECWWETGDAAFRAIPKRYTVGYRIEYWPREAREVQRMLVRAGLTDVQIRKLCWHDNFETAGKAYDFFASASASWWNAKLPPDKIKDISKKIREYFERHKVTRITHDIILAYGRKP